MKPFIHARNSVKKFGGKPEDYIKIHEWIDQTKKCHPDMRHRAILHNSFGIYLCADFFGDECGNIKNSDGKFVSVRDIAEKHVIEDMGRIPTISDYLNEMPFYNWLGGHRRNKKKILFTNKD